MTIRESIIYLRLKLEPAVGEAEATAMAQAIIEDIKGYQPIDVVMYGDRTIEPETIARIDHIAAQIIAGMPMQYVLRTAYFHGRLFSVDPTTLIPRPETSQLIDIIYDQWRNKRDARILDVGTGSGCIAISLALDIPFSEVTAIDISSPAIEIARENAQDLNVEVEFMVADALDLGKSMLAGREFDIIVSNPPYVLESEKASMDKRVVDYEPHSALFVPDDNALLYYRAIGAYAIEHLSRDGVLYFEINPLCHNQLRNMLEDIGFADVDIVRDYRGNYRFAICRR